MTKTEQIENHKEGKSNRYIPTARFRCTIGNSFSTNKMESLRNRIPFQFLTVSKKKEQKNKPTVIKGFKYFNRFDCLAFKNLAKTFGESIYIRFRVSEFS